MKKRNVYRNWLETGHYQVKLRLEKITEYKTSWKINIYMKTLYLVISKCLSEVKLRLLARCNFYLELVSRTVDQRRWLLTLPLCPDWPNCSSSHPVLLLMKPWLNNLTSGRKEEVNKG